MKIGLGGIAFIVFLVLKLTHTVDWAWVWVMAPLWISVGLGILLFAFAGLLLSVAALFGKEKNNGKIAAKRYRRRLR